MFLFLFRADLAEDFSTQRYNMVGPATVQYFLWRFLAKYFSTQLFFLRKAILIFPWFRADLAEYFSTQRWRYGGSVDRSVFPLADLAEYFSTQLHSLRRHSYFGGSPFKLR